MNQYIQEQSVRIGDDVALAAPDALEGIKASWATNLGRRHALTVDHTGGWDGAARACLSEPGHQLQVQHTQ